MTQTHPTSEVAALVPTRGGGDPFAVLSSRPIHPSASFSLETVLIHQEEFLSFSGLNHPSEISRGWTVGGSSKRGGGSSGELLKTQDLL